MCPISPSPQFVRSPGRHQFSYSDILQMLLSFENPSYSSRTFSERRVEGGGGVSRFRTQPRGASLRITCYHSREIAEILSHAFLHHEMPRYLRNAKSSSEHSRLCKDMAPLAMSRTRTSSRQQYLPATLFRERGDVCPTTEYARA
jgi:hypothetical protein